MSDGEDAREVQNDTYLRAWNSMPPEYPTRLRSYIGAICRNLSLDRYRKRNAEKRRGCVEVAIDELAAIAAPPEDSAAELAREISKFLETQDPMDRMLFMGRYFHLCSVKELAEKSGMTENNVSVRLYRVREKLRAYLNERGYRT